VQNDLADFSFIVIMVMVNAMRSGPHPVRVVRDGKMMNTISMSWFNL